MTGGAEFCSWGEISNMISVDMREGLKAVILVCVGCCANLKVRMSAKRVHHPGGTRSVSP